MDIDDTMWQINSKKILSNQGEVITPRIVLRGIAEYYHLESQDIMFEVRKAEYVRPRQIFMYLSREMTDYPYRTLAAFMGIKGNIYHGCLAEIDEMKKNAEFREQIDAITELIKTY